MMETIDPTELLIKIAPILDDLEINYVITGGMALSVWGRVRSTADIDIIVQLEEPEVIFLKAALKKISEMGYMDEDGAYEAIRCEGEFNFIDPVTGVKVDFFIAKKDLWTKLTFGRKVVKVMDGQKINFLSPEDIILSKLLWYKMSDSALQLEDVKSVLKKQKNLDFDYLKKWSITQSTDEILESLLEKST